MFEKKHFQKKDKRNIWAYGFLFVMSLQLGVFLLPPTVAFAQPAAAVVVTADVPAQVNTLEDKIEKAVLQGLLGSLVNMASYFMRTLAYDTATYIASGGKGQGSLIFEKPFDQYLSDVALDSVGEAIGSLGQGFGVNLCQPPNLKLQAQLKIALDTTYTPPSAGGKGGPKASCSWQTLKNNWKDGVNVEFDVNAASDFASEINVTQTDFGFALGAIEQIGAFKDAQEEAASLTRQVGNGFKDVTDFVSGHINTPAQLTQEESSALTGKHQGELNSQQIAGMYASQLWQIIPMSASVFLNSLTSQLLNRLFTKGLVPTEQERGTASTDFYGVNSLVSQRQIAQRAFSFLTATYGRKDPAEYDIVSEFIACPENPGANNCVMNRGFQEALDRTSVGKPITLYDAVFVDKLISANTPLISPRRVADNQDKDCYKNKLCYSNIQKMRKARILPLGMEIAALRSDTDNPWTIGEVLQKFEECPTPDQDGTIKPDFINYPFCHLVNPNWILRAPQARCENRVYSPELLVPDSPRRREECVDISTCISEDENGNCTEDNYYGFCTLEKNVWDLQGASCEPQYATCQTFTNQDSKTIVSYLTRTLEYGSCSAQSVGCLPYVTEQTGESNWVGTDDIYIADKRYGGQQVLYLNDQIAASGAGCPESGAAGCTSFIGAQRDPTTGAYITNPTDESYIQDTARIRPLKKAPISLGCYDIDPATVEIDYPETAQQIENSIPTDPRCDAYASVCLASEVGCELYTPTGSGESIPGVVGDNYCPKTCVGYDTFKQEASNFEQASYPLYFIPTNGILCSAQQVGCDEFTNIGSIETGGEQQEYYSYIKQCEVPDGDNSSTYYSWEGSESQGFILKVHRLAKVGDGTYISGLRAAGIILDDVSSAFPPASPIYADDIPAQLQENVDVCNETVYGNAVQQVPDAPKADADCRALYDSEGIVYYRLLAKTVTVSTACHPLRKTESRLVVDESLIDIAGYESVQAAQDICDEKGGYWGQKDGYSGNVCQRCVGGGAWVPEDASNPEKGSCVYYAIDAPGESTSCIAEANSCRAFTGNKGNNIKPVFEKSIDTFEPIGDSPEALSNAKEYWSQADAVSIAAESLQVNAHSLRVKGTSDGTVVRRALDPGAMETNAAYELSFWARGAGQILSISLEQGTNVWTLTVDPLTSIDEPISIGTSWREYVVGPVTFTGNTIDPVSLVFDRSSSATAGIYFIDNVSLMRTEGNVYLIRDSWKTPEGYDAPTKCFGEGQNPAGPYPGAALGCDAYTTSLGQKAYATGFDRLCREKAVGCAPLWDTYNTESTYAEVYNARCTNGRDLANGLVADVSVAVATTCEITVDTIDTYSCTIAPRESSCVIAGPIRVPSDAFLGGPYGDEGYLRIKASADEAVGTGLTKSIVMVDASSVYIPADTPVLDPVFLTDNQESACLEKYVGCQAVAIEEQTTPVAGQSNGFTYHPQMIRNNPASYLGEQGTLCTQEQLACSAYTTSNGANTYFKDPAVNANKLCSYIAPDPTNEASVGGWFLTSVGTCTNNPDIQCTTNAICGDGNTCTGIGKSVPCYENYKEDFSTYGLWSNGSDGYDGYVGECPVGQNLCTELVDPYDTDTSGKNPDGKPYYVIFDTQLTASVGECQGKASLREGCVLFDNTNIPNKSYDASATYAAGEALAKTGDTLVVPQSTDENDANVLLKVERNRECSEWIACRSYEPITLPNGQQSLLCSQLAACLEYQGTNCIKLAPVDDTRSPSEKFLDIDAYINRDTSWNGIEYTGYSLFNRYDIAEYSSVNMPQNISPSDGIVDTVNSYLGYALSEEYVEQHPEEHACATGESKSACGPDDTGRCISGTCVLPVDGVFQSSDITLDKIANTLGNAECKVPPQEDAPFPGDIVPNFDTPNARDVHGFAQKIVNTTITRRTFSQRQNNANVCQDGDDCSCNYVAVTYGSLATDYWDTDVYDEQGDNLRLWGICTGASGTEGDYCKEDAECGVGGSCQKISHLATFVGSTGHCLEYDLSRPVLSPEGQPRYACLTWYPSDKSFGNIDTSNLFQDAGYNPGIDAFTGDGGTGGQVYCTQSFGRGAATYEGTLRIHPRYGGGEITNAQVINGVGGVTLADMWEDPETQWHWSGVPGDGDRQLKTIRPTETTPQNQIVQCSQALTVSDMFTIDNDAWVMEYLYTKYYNPRLLDFFRNIRPALQDPDEIARQQYSEILDRIALNGCTDMYGNPYSPVEMDGNPYWWYVCGAKYAGQTFGSDDSSTCSAQSTGSYTVDESLNALYSLVTLFSWYTLAPSPGALNTNAVVLRVEGDYNGNNFGSSPQGNNAYKVGALVPVASEFDSAVDASTLNFDTGTMMHPPRFGANNAIYSFTNFKVSTASNPPAVSLNTTCLAAGGCSSAENTSLLFQSTVTEKNLNRNALRSVYFVPFRIPVRNALGPAPLTEELKINFNGYGDLGVNGSVLTSDGTMTPWYPSSDPYLPPESYPKKTTKRSITTYELVRTPSSTVNCEGLVSYCDYGGSGDDSEVHTQYALSPGNPSVGEVRNQVHYRSVMVFYKSEGGTNTPSFVQESDGPFVKAVSPETDPFSIACNATKGNFFAIGMDFNKNGEFLGYITRNCGSYGLQLGVVATMNDQCSEFVSVYQDVGATGQSNKAWTDRVWKESNYQLLGQSAFGHDVSRAPFGSTDLSASDLLGISNDVDKQGNLLKYAFMSEGATGYPYYCRAASELNIKVFAKTALEMCDTLTQNGYSTTAIQSIANWMNSSSITSGRDVLLSLFGAYYVRAVFPFDSVQPGGDIHEINPILAAGLQPPKIYSLNPETCFPSVLTSSQLSTQCSAGSLNNLSVGFNDDDAQIVSKVIYQARARFFGFADDDRMPIRRVLVDWGDGTITNKGLTGMYKNRKPYCEESNSPGDTSEVGYCKDSFTNTPTSLTCKADQDCPTGYACTDYSLPAFGNLPRACETGPFDYAHTYGCDSPNQTVGQIRDQISEQTYNTLLQSGLNDDSPLCVYQPRVQILDNWGYCNGTCNGEGTPGCYNSSSDFGEKQCDNPQFDDVHWTTYQGLIIITP